MISQSMIVYIFRLFYLFEPPQEISHIPLNVSVCKNSEKTTEAAPNGKAVSIRSDMANSIEIF
jgi:hypothetical protein